MPRLYNVDHSPTSIENGLAVAPGESYDFTDEQVEAGIAGAWSQTDPRGPAPQGKSPAPPVEQSTEPAPPENQEQSA